ncbi:MAG TPA: hypothetical protein VHD84_02465 [Candidatus Saccharimonadales bacterium]|nr:hypothetical protein [Candidatus Saccharimonadales bacterium]
MKQKDLMVIGAVAFVAAIFSFVISDALFGSPQKNPIKVPVVTKIDSTFPDVKNNTAYQSFLNGQALNPTQLIQIGNNNNTAPFQQATDQ